MTKLKIIALLLVSFLFIFENKAQDSTEVKTGDNEKKLDKSFSGFREYYPISIKPNFSYLSSYSEYEADILFDAKPVVYYSIVNKMRQNIQHFNNKPSDAIYISFQPHIRMYSENSLPVKTPSYKILFGWQRLYKTSKDNFFSFLIESGHYSNGQSGCAFNSSLDDETTACTDFYATINSSTNLSALLNRANGNYSTNFTKLAINFRFNNLHLSNKPYKVHSIGASWEIYHNNMFWLINKGGFSSEDIEIYGRNRFGFQYEFIHTYTTLFRWSASLNLEIIQGAHEWVEPLRTEFTFTFYPFARDIGIFASYIYGHDNYNYRFIDSGNQISIGFAWDWFSPFEIKRAETIRSTNEKS